MATINQERLTRISKLISPLIDRKIIIEEVDNIEGDRRNAIVYTSPDGECDVKITSELANDLDDDELIWIITHETAHIEHGDAKRNKELVDNYAELLREKAETIDNMLKEGGGGLIKRMLVQIGFLSAGVAGSFIAIKHDQREREKKADSRAAEILKRLGGNSSAPSTALDKLRESGTHYGGFISALVSAHPDTEERKRLLQNSDNKKG